MKLRDVIAAATSKCLAEALRQCGGNVSAAARMAGCNRAHFYVLLRRHNVKLPERRVESPRWREMGL